MNLPEELRSCYEQGRLVGASGGRIDEMPRYRSQGREAAWLRGYHRGRHEAEVGAVKLTEEEKAVGRAAIAAIRASLGMGEMPSGWIRDQWIWHRWAKGRTACGRWWLVDMCQIHPNPQGRECPHCRFWLDWRAEQSQQQPGNGDEGTGEREAVAGQ